MTQNDSDTTPLSFATYFAATERDTLPERRPVLLGTFLKPEGKTALFRLQDGALRYFKVGDLIGQAKILSIAEGTAQLSLLGQVHQMQIPGDD